MEVKIYGKEENTKELINKIKTCLDELWLVEFIKVETTIDESLKKELNITKEPALIVIEEAIDFKDIIFEWISPDEEELKSMFISIIWWSAPEWCWTDMWWCPTGCSC